MPAGPAEFTVLLHQWRSGDEAAAGKLMELAYQQLRLVAAKHMKRERPDHTLQPTALVHELCARLLGGSTVDWQDRAHFFSVASLQIRRLLVNHARDRRAAKRGGGAQRVDVAECPALPKPLQEDLIALDQVLSRLEQLDPRAAKVVELRFFGGLNENEAAAVLGISVATLKRDWEFARAWLLTELMPG